MMNNYNNSHKSEKMKNNTPTLPHMIMVLILPSGDNK